MSENYNFISLSTSHLWTFIQEGVPDLEEDVAHHTVHKHHQEPVEGDEGEVHLVLLKVGVKPGELLTHQVPEHTLVNLHRHNQHTFIFFDANRQKEKTNSAAFFPLSVMRHTVT